MYFSNPMNSSPFQRIPPGWFIQRREHLETYYQELSVLKHKISRFSSHQNIPAALNAAKSLEQLNKQIETMEKTLESKLPDLSGEEDFYNKGDLRRIKELCIATSIQLKAIAGQISWGMSTDSQISQVTRNLYPLLDLIQDTLDWLEQGINS